MGRDTDPWPSPDGLDSTSSSPKPGALSLGLDPTPRLEPGKWGVARSNSPCRERPVEGGAGRCSLGLQTRGHHKKGKKVPLTGHLEVRTGDVKTIFNLIILFFFLN